MFFTEIFIANSQSNKTILRYPNTKKTAVKSKVLFLPCKTAKKDRYRRGTGLFGLYGDFYAFALTAPDARRVGTAGAGAALAGIFTTAFCFFLFST